MRVGFDVQETERAFSFRAHGVASVAPVVAEDTSNDDRYDCNPLAVGEGN